MPWGLGCGRGVGAQHGEDVARATGQHLLGNAHTQCIGLGQRGRCGFAIGGKFAGAVLRGNESAQAQRAGIRPLREGGQRHLARAAEDARDSTFSSHGQRSWFIVQRRETGLHIGAIGADFDAECALPRGRQRFFRRDCAANALGLPQAFEPGSGQDDGGVVTTVKLAQARIEVTAQRLNDQMREARSQRSLTAQAGRAHHGAGR